MSRIAYVDGRYLPITAATVSIEDRGFQFADSIYEVLKRIGGRLVDADRHLARLRRSLAELRIEPPCSDAALRRIVKETLARNALGDALIYIQVSRGTAPRNHPFPAHVRPTLVVTVRRLKLPSRQELLDGAAVITCPDQRWGRCDIKSTGLLPNVLAKQEAHEAGCREAWLVAGEPSADAVVTEGSSTNAWIVDEAGALRTHPATRAILGGVTRSVVLDLARAAGIAVEERAFTMAELARAREAFLTSATSLVLPVTSIDGRPVANGRPGDTTRRLMADYATHCGAALLTAG
jgi:D-alanine transaminase